MTKQVPARSNSSGDNSSCINSKVRGPLHYRNQEPYQSFLNTAVLQEYVRRSVVFSPGLPLLPRHLSFDDIVNIWRFRRSVITGLVAVECYVGN